MISYNIINMATKKEEEDMKCEKRNCTNTSSLLVSLPYKVSSWGCEIDYIEIRLCRDFIMNVPS